MLKASPNAQLAVARNRNKFLVEKEPTLNNIATAYGRTAPIQWLIAQLINLSEFCGVKDKMSGDQCEELAWLIAGEYSYYSVSQFLVFFHDFKIGKFGKFFGSVDPLVITTALREFEKDRVWALSQKENEERFDFNKELADRNITFDDFMNQVVEPKSDEEVEISKDLYDEAMAIMTNSYHTSKDVLKAFSKLFEKTNGIVPDKYVDLYLKRK